jgi:hypothetical protein
MQTQTADVKNTMPISPAAILESFWFPRYMWKLATFSTIIINYKQRIDNEGV